ncbi:tRNA pseudouridine(55) synthase TruB [Neorhodopirellula lusitana]|nr:tRNA pseudouridine(55) synthase TruB [Neorhodopirellula lusitana]
MKDTIPTAPFGFLPFNKPKGMTSRDLANRIQRRLRRENENRKLKVGHTGTLDPLASGLVVLAVGSATRLTPWMLKPTKRYVATFRLGAHSESGDLEEPVIEIADAVMPTRSQVEQALTGFSGWVDQTPPTHSAIWVNGERAHERIRRGEEVEMPTRRVWLGAIELLRYEPPIIQIDVTCGSGTYLRSLGIDIAAACQTAAVMTALVRTEVGRFDLDSAIDCIPPNDPPPVPGMPLRHELTPMSDLEEVTGSPWLTDSVRSPIPALAHMPRMDLDRVDAYRVRNGLYVTGEPATPDCLAVPPEDPNPKPNLEGDPYTAGEMITVDPAGELVAIMRLKKGEWAPFRVFAPTSDQLQS